jgi:hypothetical protein
MEMNESYLIEVRIDPRDGLEFWGVWGSGTLQELITKKYNLEEQSQRYGRPQNLGQLLIVYEADVAEHVYGYGEWDE